MSTRIRTSALHSAALLLLGLSLYAQAPQPGASQPGPPPAPARMPPRDSSDPAPKGTSRIRGHVVAAEDGKPLGRARIRLSSPDLRESRSVITDADGRYEAAELPGGRYQIFASRLGYVELQYGQARAFEQGRPLELAAGQTLDRIDFALPRGAVISGRITDEKGEPVPAVRVQAMRYSYLPSGLRQLVYTGSGPYGTFVTDDLGNFRIYGLMPGTYVISGGAMPGFGALGGDADGLGTTYYPGTALVDQAQALTVGIGEEQAANFALVPTRMSRVSGVVVDSQGRPAARRQLMLGTRSETMTSSRTVGQTGPDGSFSIPNLAPGEYSIDVSPYTPTGILPAQEMEYASFPISVSDVDITGLTIATAQGSTVRGLVLFEGTVPKPIGTLRVLPTAAEPTGPGRVSSGNRDDGLVDSNGRFQITRVNGRVVFRLLLPPAPQWQLKSVSLNGVDITDIAHVVSRDVDGLQVVLTDRQTSLGGVVTNALGRPVTDYVVIIFPANLKEGVLRTRFVRTARPDQQGRYITKGLPPGNYFAVAVESLEQGAHFNPAFQEQVKPRGKPFTLAEGQTITLDLPLFQTP